MHKENFIPEVIEAIDDYNQESWYFALIEDNLYEIFEQGRDMDNVDIRQDKKGLLFVCVDGQKCGHVIDNGPGKPEKEAEKAFVEKYGVPVRKKDTEPGGDNGDGPDAEENEKNIKSIGPFIGPVRKGGPFNG